MKMLNKKLTEPVSRLSIVVIVLLAIALFCLGWYSGSCRGERMALREYSRRRDYLISLVLNYNDPTNAPAERYQALLQDEPTLVTDNLTNRGAEILYRLGTRGMSETDTDSDGRPEACDEWGTPFVFLTGDHPTDIIVTATFREPVSVPPYYGRGFYISSLMLHPWSDSHESALTLGGQRKNIAGYWVKNRPVVESQDSVQKPSSAPE
ncbi:MAG: hypothetical protein JW741_02195 [Sedimentisphaerales bacterium]|nr:hypothetical protein [Sedimentisphaerales bacterium]